MILTRHLLRLTSLVRRCCVWSGINDGEVERHEAVMCSCHTNRAPALHLISERSHWTVLDWFGLILMFGLCYSQGTVETRGLPKLHKDSWDLA